MPLSQVAPSRVSLNEMLPGPSTLFAAVRDPAGTQESIAAVLPALADHRYLLLTTTKKDGTPVGTPVWFAATGDALVATSEETAWKVKRLRREPRATVAPCDARGRPLGPPVEVVGALLPAEDQPAAEAALARRYGAAFEAIGLVGRLRQRGRAPRRAFMSFRPVGNATG